MNGEAEALCKKCGVRIWFAFTGIGDVERWADSEQYYHCERISKVFMPHLAHVPETPLDRFSRFVREELA